jgi:hypothetical protein
MNGFLHKTLHPEIFQGTLSKRKYFEGWYYKMVSHDEKYAFAFIPGISLFDRNDRHAFIQVIDGVTQTTHYYRFDINDFKSDRKELVFSIGNNHFTKNRISIDLPEIKGDLNFSDIISPRSTLISPGVMGWFAYVPFMQCKHGIVSLSQRLHGITTHTFGEIDWKGGKGYIEKDWGRSFPKCWIWIQSNHFPEDGQAALMASVAHIPWMGRSFPGFIVVMYCNGKEYRFATYNNSQMKCLVFDDKVILDFKHHHELLSIIAYRGDTITLHTPEKGQMTGKLNESLNASVEVILKNSGHVIWSGKGTSAGMDVSGDVSILESPVWRD